MAHLLPPKGNLQQIGNTC